jgi:hypothetical protein
MTFHTAHLTFIARAALVLPGTWAWQLVLRAGLATRPCRNRKHLEAQR